MPEPVTITYLELLSPSEHRVKSNDDPQFSVLPVDPTSGLNKHFYVEVGRAWQWTERLEWSDRDWLEYARAPNVHTFAAYYGGEPAGYYELRRERDDVELVYFGMMPDFVGKGLGGAFLSSAIEDAFALGAGRVWVHTCSLDHPAALANYRARGFKVYKTVTESS